MKLRPLAMVFAALALQSVVGLSVAADAPSATSQMKVIQIGELSTSNALKFTVKSNKASYAVGESMHFTVQGGRPFYVYVYNQQPDGSNVLLYPNKKEKSRLLPANKAVTLPKLVRFFSDRPGTETVSVIATTQPLVISPASLKDAGDFSVANKGAVESALSARQIQIGEINNVPTTSGDTVMRTLNVAITAANNVNAVLPSAPVEAGNAAAFITADKPSYRVGEQLQITYGATRAGFVHLYVVYPDGGAPTSLGMQRVNVGEAVSLNAKAALPAGRQLLVAAYSPTEKINDGFLKPLSSSTNFKGIVFVDPNGATIGAVPAATTNVQQVPVATFQIKISG